MRPNEDDAALLWDMRVAAQRVVRFCAQRTVEEFVADDYFQSAVERQVEIIGEAARRISEEFRKAHAEVPWRPIIAQRHILAHEYGEIEPALIWRVATRYVPEIPADAGHVASR